jgi:hypothetical protein
VRFGGPPRGDQDEISGVFQPNAPGRGELRSLAGLHERQLLKGRSQHVGERVRLAVSDRMVRAWRLGPFSLFHDLVGEWPTANLLTLAVPPRGVHRTWPAIVLLDLERLEFVADLRAVRDGPVERAVVRRLRSSSRLVVARS